MLYWAIVFLAIAIIAGIFGFTAIVGVSVWVAKVLFFTCIILFVLFVLFGRRRSVPPA